MSKHVEILEQNGYHFLWIDGQLWMWDIPAEVELQKAQADVAYGDVLVAGYGLGIVQKFLLQNPRVKIVTTAEIEKEVIDLCSSRFGLCGQVHWMDFYNLIETNAFDCIIGDIWPEISSKHLDLYKRFKEKALTMLKPSGKIIGWGAEYYEYLITQEQANKSL